MRALAVGREADDVGKYKFDIDWAPRQNCLTPNQWRFVSNRWLKTPVEGQPWQLSQKLGSAIGRANSAWSKNRFADDDRVRQHSRFAKAV